MARLSVLAIFWCLTVICASAQQVVAYRSAVNYAGRVDTLRMRVWLPETDGINRPLMIWIHGGAFMSGDYRELDSACARYARRGYVAATVQYRLGFYSPFPVDPPFAYDRAEIVRACWRGVQDIRAAIRFLHASADTYGIDTTCTVLAGVSAGSIIALQTAISDVSDSIPNEVGQIGDVQRGFDRFPRPDLGALDDVNTGPLPPISTVVNYYGAIMHPYMVDARAFPALVSYHQRDDRVVGCGIAKGLWGMPLDVGANFPVLWGTCAIDQLLSDGGHEAAKRRTMIHDGFEHALHNPALIDSLTAEFVEDYACSPVTTVNERILVEADTWTAYDVLGRLLASGTGGMTEGQRWAEGSSYRVVFILSGESCRVTFDPTTYCNH